MNQIRRKSSFWSLAGPLLGYWLIQMAVIVVVELVIAVPTMSDMLRELSSGSVSSQKEFAEFYVSAMETLLRQVMSYQAQITAAAALGTLIMTVILFRKDRQLEVTYNIPQWKKAPVSKYWPVAVMGIVGCIGVTCLSAMVQLVLYDPQYQDATAAVYSSSFPVELICLGIISPVAEEMMFRGVMFRRYRENRGFFYSALWSSVFFALMHTNMIQLVYSFLLGILLSYLYEKFGSVKAPVFLHILLNSGSVVFTETGVFDWLGGGAERMAAAVIVSAFICSAMFVLIQKMRDWGDPNPPEKPKKEQDGSPFDFM
ncbi:hypothetical protein B5F07_14490 [Lachnoclostridium sp. An169]|uniref:CPBP family intramembrane glutamic endopeptidase n=1 Tax=Lachnoclostridium sp. An169 TaxID=1965569 RepID=UPI000B39204F|nr:type II CAAX endopeptidase family protein [Lachnoclostridium sp. An169]OUP82312.1 hypothetical protein B5F07_14490 [Lachnoclostridium sp. An169]HJA66499.1 CPBP family intramembrane metalloprotease [Candidatus Mediterraneibacter cottocaccae]